MKCPSLPCKGTQSGRGTLQKQSSSPSVFATKSGSVSPSGTTFPMMPWWRPPNGFLKVQVKVMTPEKARGVHTARLTKTFYHEGKYQQARYAHGDFDLFVGYAIDLDRFVMLPWGKIKNHSGVSIRFESENKWSPYIDRWDLLT